LTAAAYVLPLQALGATAARELSRSHLDIRPIDPARQPLYRWVRDVTPRGAIFAGPPDWKDFRLVAQRAVVADWAVPPARPDEMIEWYGRLRDVVGQADAVSLESVLEGYRVWIPSQSRI
jgi:hypothetical protein